MASKDKFEFSSLDSLYEGSFESMFRSGEYTDVTIKVGNRTFRSHRMILAAVFPFFNTRLKRNQDNIVLRNVDPDAFDSLLNFAYKGKISVVSENVKKLLAAANYLQHTKIRDSCFEFLSGQFSPENVLELRALGRSMSCYQFVKKADSFIGEKFDLLRKTQAFVNASYELIKEIISRPDIEVKKPENVYKAISRWTNADSGRINTFAELVRCVQKELPVPFKRREDEPETEKIPIPRTLLDIPYKNEEVFGIYTVSASASYNRIVHNYNSYTSSWSLIAQHNQPRSFMTVVSASGLIFAFTGDNLEYFDRHSWTSCGVLPWEVRTRSGNAVSRGHKIYWFPNIADKDCSLWCFNVESQKWKKEVTSVKLISAGVVSLEGYIYVLGGSTPSGVTSAAMTYDPYYKNFEYISPMLESRSSPRCAALNGMIYVCGGYGTRSVYLDTAEVYDTSNRQWQFIAPMRNRWCNFSVVPCEGKLFLIGCHANLDGTVEIYDPSRNVWESGPDFPDRCVTLKAVVVST